MSRWPTLERAASEIWVYHPLMVPGLLQTEEYAAHILRVSHPLGHSSREIEELVRGQMERKAIFDQERPPRLIVVVDEGVLRRPTGGREVMRRQIGHLLQESSRPFVSIQVVPYDSEHHPGLSNGFALFTVPGRTRSCTWRLAGQESPRTIRKRWRTIPNCSPTCGVRPSHWAVPAG